MTKADFILSKTAGAGTFDRAVSPIVEKITESTKQIQTAFKGLSTRQDSAKAFEAAYNKKSLEVAEQLKARGISDVIAKGTGQTKVSQVANPKRAAETLKAFAAQQSAVGKALIQNRKSALPELYKAIMSSRKAESLLKGAALKGGLAEKEGKTKKDFDPKAVAQGAKVEAEHTSNKAMREEIAMDHLTEDPKYYDKLKKMEKK